MEDANPRELTNRWRRSGTVISRFQLRLFLSRPVFDQQYRQDEVFGLIVALFAALAIFISCMGLWVLVMFSCSTRIREMGIRKVLEPPKCNCSVNWGANFCIDRHRHCNCPKPLSWWIMNGWLSYYSSVPTGKYGSCCSGSFIVWFLYWLSPGKPPRLFSVNRHGRYGTNN